jgi:hypothetical protein
VSARRDDGPVLTVIRWQEIPAQVTARDGERSARAELPGRFQRAIDRAAMGGGLAGSEEYLAHWVTQPRPCGADLEAEVAAEVAALEDTHPRERIEEIVRAVRAARPTRGEEPTA